MSVKPTLKGVVSYYDNMTWNYNAYSKGAYGWHYGIYDGSARTRRDASLNSNRKLTSGVALGPGSRVLDLGCGVGGLATWAAQELGCHVTGITVVPAHVDFGRRLAQKRGVSHLCTFEVMDMMDLQFDDESFDLIVNQETLCFVPDKTVFLRRLFELLKPNAWWQSVDFSIREGELSADEEERHRLTCDKWFFPPLASIKVVESALAEVGFEATQLEDITPLVLSDARRIVRFCRVAAGLTRLKLDHLVSRDPQYREDFQRHITAGMNYSKGLIEGPFRHNFYSARKPQTRPS